VQLVKSIVEGMGRALAMPDEARAILALKGAENVSF
jgi:uncharacterized protein (DUF849 family)